MAYTIIYEKKGQPPLYTPWGQGLARAKEHAKLQMQAHGCDRVEIQNDKNEIVFQWPRTVKKAP